MTCFCPNCGFDIKRTEPIHLGDVAFDPWGDVVWKGERIELTPDQRLIVSTLLSSPERAVSRETLALRLDYDGPDPRNVIDVKINRIRRRWPGVPIKTERGLGYRWTT